MSNPPRLMLRCAYGLTTAAWEDDRGTKHLDISHTELDRYQKLLKKKLKRDSTMLELYEQVRKDILQ
jgi:hypothetical protein